MSLVEKFRKNEICSFPFYDLTRSGIYRKYLKFFESSADWSNTEIDKWQFQKTYEIVKYAYQHVPFYKKYYDENNVDIEKINNWNDFEKLPCIDKEMVKKNGELLYSDEYKKIPCRFDYTGGSTGQPMKFLVDEDLYQREDAIYRYYWRSLGFDVGSKCVVLRGRKIFTEKNHKVYEFNQFWNYMYLDSSYLNDEYFELYDKAIRNYRAKNIQAYPSSIILLARLYEQNGIKAPKFERIILSSENVSETDIGYLKRVFQCHCIYNQYGHSEKAVIALQLPDGKSLAFDPFYGYFELLNDENNNIVSPDILGEITATGFNKSMPLIRYRTSDMAYLSDETSSSYMKYWKKISGIEGRLQEFIYTKSGRAVSVCTVGGAHISELNSILDMQYEQLEKGKLIIDVLAKGTLDDQIKKQISKEYEELFNGDITCDVKQVDRIKRTSRDKKIMLITNL